VLWQVRDGAERFAADEDVDLLPPAVSSAGWTGMLMWFGARFVRYWYPRNEALWSTLWRTVCYVESLDTLFESGDVWWLFYEENCAGSGFVV
jgi:hypothetical protein